MKIVKQYGVYFFAVVVIALIIYSFLKKPEQFEPISFHLEETEQQEIISYIYVDIKGAVMIPGVYKVEQFTRLFQVIDLAGGFDLDADMNAVNLSVMLSDQDVIYIPTIEEGFPNVSENPDEELGNLININTATMEQLQELQGVGPSTAQSIIDYRNEHGPFESIEDIMNVSGIGESTFNEIKNSITT